MNVATKIVFFYYNPTKRMKQVLLDNIRFPLRLLFHENCLFQLCNVSTFQISQQNRHMYSNKDVKLSELGAYTTLR